MNRYTFLIFFILLIHSTQIFGQEEDTLRKKEIYFGVASAAYKGDLNNSFDKWSLVYNIGIKLNRFNKLNGNFNISIGQVSGQNIKYTFDDGSSILTTPNSFFTAKIVGLNYELHYNFIDRDNLKLYVSQGIGLLRFDPQNQFNESLANLPSTRAFGEVYGNIAIFFPSQIGILYYLPNNFSFGFQMGYWGTATDYLDNISQWSNSSGGDNVFSTRFEVHIPVNF